MKLFNDNVLQVFRYLRSLETDYFIKFDVANNLGMSFSTVSRVIKGYDDAGIISVVRQVGRSNYYKIDRDHPVYRALEVLADATDCDGSGHYHTGARVFAR